MKLSSLTIQNIRSYRDKTRFSFTTDLNILVGPNAGGKTNALRILTIVLSNYLLPKIRIEARDKQWKLTQEALPPQELSRWLSKYVGQESVSSEIEIELSIEESDLNNIHRIIAHREEISQVFVKWGHDQKIGLSDEAIAAIKGANTVTYWIKDGLAAFACGQRL